ncbi:MAG: type I methionyl aminopeptidase, partial [Patescibacteria group bacterium]
MISIKTSEEIKILREGGKILTSVLFEVAGKVRSGISTIELDELAEKLIRKNKGEPSFKNYKTRDDKFPYPASLCVSINDEIVHGIPLRDKILKEGNIVSLDLGMKYKNLYTDMAVTVRVGEISKKAEKLIKITKKCLEEGIKKIKPKNYIGDIGFAVQNCAEKNGFNVVKRLVGHGVGYQVHEDPEIPNFGQPKTGIQLKTGMVLALEPMVVE